MTRFLPLAVAVALLAGGARASTCNPRLDRTAPDSRYLDNGDGTATDLRTGLTWQRCPLGTTWSDGGTPGFPADDRCLDGGSSTFLWQAALQAAVDLNAGGGYAGHADWRLPNAKELSTLLELGCHAPALNDHLFPDAGTDSYYSSTPYAQAAATSVSVRACSFGGAGRCGLVGKSGIPRRVRLVRG